MKWITGLLIAVFAVFSASSSAFAATNPPQTQPALQPTTRRPLDLSALWKDRGDAKAPASYVQRGPVGSEFRFGAFNRPAYADPPRRDFMRAGRAAVGLAVSFKLGS